MTKQHRQDWKLQIWTKSARHDFIESHCATYCPRYDDKETVCQMRTLALGITIKVL